MAQVYQIGHEGNDFSEYSGTNLGSDLTITTPGLGGTTYAANGAANSSLATIWANRTFSAITGTVFRFGWRIARDDLVPASSASGLAKWWENEDLFDMYLVISGGTVTVSVDCFHAGGTGTIVSSDIGDDDTAIELRIGQSSADMVLDGSFILYVNGVQVAQLSNIDNYTEFESGRTAGAAVGNRLLAPNYFGGSGDFSGAMRVDLCTFRNDDTPIFPPPITGELTVAPMFKVADIDSDGVYLYIAGLNDSGTPVLVKMLADLSADGELVFDPGAGDNIGVQCSDLNADKLWVGGNFGTEIIEVSDDAGVSFTDISPSNLTIDNLNTFSIVDNDSRIMIAADQDGLVSNVSLAESINGGTDWTIRHPSGIEVLALARLDKNVEEVVTGGEASDVDNVDYSINSGVDLQDRSDGFPIADVSGLEVG